jgi:hypothetical protein
VLRAVARWYGAAARTAGSVVLQLRRGPQPSGALHKISEIYDLIAFAAVGRYNEHENLGPAIAQPGEA